MKKLFLILTLLMFVLSCGSKNGSNGNTFTLNIVTEPSSIDPLKNGKNQKTDLFGRSI